MATTPDRSQTRLFGGGPDDAEGGVIVGRGPRPRAELSPVMAQHVEAGDLSPQEILEVHQRLEYARCEDDPAYFLAHYWTIRTKAVSGRGRRSRVLFPLRPFQFDLLDCLAAGEWLWVLKGRQIGFTELIAGYFAWWAAFVPDSPLFYVSKDVDDAKKVLLSCRDVGFRNLPHFLHDMGVPTVVNKNEKIIRWSNEATLELDASGSGEPVRGSSASVVVLDEFSFYKDPERALNAAEPACEHGGQLMVNSTSTGPDGLFPEMFWDGWRAGPMPVGGGLGGTAGGFRMAFYGWRAVPERDDTWYAQRMARAVGNRERRSRMAREHPDSPEDAFANVGRLVFDPDLVDAQAALVRDGLVPSVGTLNDEGEFVAVPEGPLAVWRFPEELRAEEDGALVIGADTARGVLGGDANCAYVLCRGGEVVAEWHAVIGAHQFGRALLALGRWYGSPLIGVELQGSGQVVLRVLVEGGYPRIYQAERTRLAPGTDPSEAVGWHTNPHTKPILVENVKEAMRAGLMVARSAGLVSELRGYVKQGAGNKMGGSPHDDRVMAYGLAVTMFTYAGVPAAAFDASSVKHSEEWWAQLARANGKDWRGDDLGGVRRRGQAGTGRASGLRGVGAARSRRAGAGRAAGGGGRPRW